MIVFTKRNLLVFFKDKMAVFFSLLSSFIIIALYLLFLGDSWSSGMDGVENARGLMDTWIMAGLIAVTPLTASMGAFGIMINDKTTKIYKDFYCSYISRVSITAGYIFSAFIIGVLLSVVTLVFAQGYILIQGGSFLGFLVILKVLALIIVATFMSTSIVLFIVSFFNSQNAFATASTITGTLIGFLTGIYVPIGVLPNAVQFVIKIFPPSHSATLMRQIIMEKNMTLSFANLPEQAVLEIKEILGVVLKLDDYIITPTIHILVLIGTGLLFFGLALLSMSRKSK